MGTRNPHEVPACAADAEVQLRDESPLGFCPAFAKRNLAEIGLVRQDAALTQKHGMQLHAGQLLGAAGTWIPSDSAPISSEVTGALEEECSRMKSSEKPGASGLAAMGSVPGRVEGRGWLTDWKAFRL